MKIQEILKNGKKLASHAGRWELLTVYGTKALGRFFWRALTPKRIGLLSAMVLGSMALKYIRGIEIKGKVPATTENQAVKETTDKKGISAKKTVPKKTASAAKPVSRKKVVSKHKHPAKLDDKKVANS